MCGTRIRRQSCQNWTISDRQLTDSVPQSETRERERNPVSRPRERGWNHQAQGWRMNAVLKAQGERMEPAIKEMALSSDRVNNALGTIGRT